MRPAGRGYVPELESLRGWAIVVVAIYHARQTLPGRPRHPFTGEAVPLLEAFPAAGHSGVSLFFVLSAFLLARPFLRQAAGGPAVLRSHYIARRALRILPLYWTTVCVAALWTTWAGSSGPPTWTTVASFLTFANGLGLGTPLPPFSAPWWSLAAEIQFYLVLPLLPWCLASRGRRLLTAGVIVGLYAAFLRGWLEGTGSMAERGAARHVLAHSLIGRAPAFLVGIAVAAWFDRHGATWRARLGERRWMRNGGGDALLLIVVLALAALLREVARRSYQLCELLFPAWHVVEAGLWGAVLALVLVAPLRCFRLVSNRPLERLGLLSYSIYLSHYPILFLGTPWLAQHSGEWPVAVAWRPWIGAVLLLLASVLLSTVTYRWIERPFLVKKLRWGPERPPISARG